MISSVKNYKDPVELPSLDALVTIYSGSMQISLDAERLILRTIELGRLAINAEVVATKASSSGLTFSVIAKDVSRVARDITSAITKLHESSKMLAAHAVKGAAKARLCEKYFQAWERGMEGNNAVYLLAIRENDGMMLIKTLRLMETQLGDSARQLKDLEKMTLYIPVVATMFNIETAKAVNMGEQFLGMGESLLRFNEGLSQDLMTLLKDVKKTLGRFNTLKY